MGWFCPFPSSAACGLLADPWRGAALSSFTVLSPAHSSYPGVVSYTMPWQQCPNCGWWRPGGARPPSGPCLPSPRPSRRALTPRPPPSAMLGFSPRIIQEHVSDQDRTYLFGLFDTPSACWFQLPHLRSPYARHLHPFAGHLATPFGMGFGEGDAMKRNSVKRSAFSLNEGKAFSE